MSVPKATAAPLASRVWCVAEHELTSCLSSPLSWIFLGGFVITLQAGLWLVADVFNSDHSSVRVMFEYLPWLALVFVPALAMRAWPSETQSRNMELMQTLPLGLASIVLGKFAAGAIVLLVFLVLTAPFPATLAYLGDLDAGVVISSYLAGALLLWNFFAIALLCSVAAREQASSFVLGTVTLFVLTAGGWEVTADTAQGIVPAYVIQVIQQLSPMYWIGECLSGRLEYAALAYFAATTAAFLIASFALASYRVHRKVSLRSLIVLAAIGLTIVPLAWTLQSASMFLDVTEHKEFTISQVTRQILDALPSDTAVTLYYSADQESMPVSIRSHARRVESFLSILESRSGGRLDIESVTPSLDTELELEALERGVQRITLSSGAHFYFGAAFEQGGQTGVIPYFDLSRSRFIEYDIAVILASFAAPQVPRVGLLGPAIQPRSAIAGAEGLSILSQLRKSYDVAAMPFFTDELAHDLDLLVLFNAKVMRASLLRQIDDFLINGGNVIAMLDPFSRLDLAGNAVNTSISSEINDVSDLLAHYGIRYMDHVVVGNRDTGMPVTTRGGASIAYPFWIRFGVDGASLDHPVAGQQRDLLLAEPGSFELDSGSFARPLLITGPGSGELDKKVFSRLGIEELAYRFESDSASRVVAAAVQGGIGSAFDDRTDPAHEKPGTLIAIADADWIHDQFSAQVRHVDGNAAAVPINGNRQWFLNLVEYLTGSYRLDEIRLRDEVNRRFTRVAEIVSEAGESVQQSQSELGRRVFDIEQRIEQLIVESGAASAAELPEGVSRQIAELQIQALPLRSQMRELRLQVRESVQLLRTVVLAVNLASGPLIILLLLWLYRRTRTAG